MSRSATAVAGLLAVGALVVPVAQAAPPPDPNDIPDPSTVPDLPPTGTPIPVDTPDPGEPPDATDDGEDPLATPTPVVTATPEPTVVSTPEPTATASPEPTATATVTASPEPTPTPVEQATPEAAVTAEPTPVSTPVLVPEVKEPDAETPHPAEADRRTRAEPKRKVARSRDKARLPVRQSTRPVARDQAETPSTPVASTPRVTAVRTRAGRTHLAGRTYVIQPGDTLSGIAVRYGLDWHRLAILNDLENPDLIYAGATLLLH